MTAQDYEIELRRLQLRTRRRRKKFIISLLIWCVCIWGIMYRLFGISVVDGNSMRPAFLPGDIVIYRRGFTGNITYNDVVIVDTGIKEKIIKRIVGLPGDVIDIDEKGHITRNGEAVREPEVLFGYQDTSGGITFPYTVPENCYFYMGDNRPVSLDGRMLGAVEKSRIKGKVIVLIRAGSWANKTR